MKSVENVWISKQEDERIIKTTTKQTKHPQQSNPQVGSVHVEPFNRRKTQKCKKTFTILFGERGL